MTVDAPSPPLRWRQPRGPTATESGFQHCRRLMAAYAFLLPVQFGVSATLRIAVSDLFVIAYLMRRGSRLRRVPAAWSRWAYALVIVVWTGVLVALAQTGAMSQTTFLAKAIGLLVLLGSFAALVDVAVDWATLRTIARAFLLGVLTNVTLALTAYVVLRTTGMKVPLFNAPYEASRLTGLLIDPNAFGGIIATALVLHLVTSCAGAPLLSRGWARFADLALPVGLLLTFSRSAWIGAVLGSLFVGVATPGVLARMAARVVPPAVAGVMLASFWLPSFSSLVSRPGQVTARVSIADNALRDFIVDPLFGTGLGVFSSTHGVIVHNSTLWFLTELGLVGFGVFLGFLLAYASMGLRTVRQLSGQPRALALALYAGIGVGLGVSVGIEAFYQRYWWLMFAGTAAAHGLARREQP